MIVPEEVQSRFWSKVQKSDKCWAWTAFRNRKGYGQFVWRKMGRPHLAHRFVLMMLGIEIPPGMLVLHKCDNPGCVRPDHLWIGTAAENSNDMVKKNRSRKGENNQRAKLKYQDVLEIRDLYFVHRCTQPVLAKKYGVSRTAISSIVTGRNWKSL